MAMFGLVLFGYPISARKLAGLMPAPSSFWLSGRRSAEAGAVITI
jgi:hypothetical protein